MTDTVEVKTEYDGVPCHYCGRVVCFIPRNAHLRAQKLNKVTCGRCKRAVHGLPKTTRARIEGSDCSDALLSGDWR